MKQVLGQAAGAAAVVIVALCLLPQGVIYNMSLLLLVMTALALTSSVWLGRTGEVRSSDRWSVTSGGLAGLGAGYAIAVVGWAQLKPASDEAAIMAESLAWTPIVVLMIGVVPAVLANFGANFVAYLMKVRP